MPAIRITTARAAILLLATLACLVLGTAPAQAASPAPSLAVTVDADATTLYGAGQTGVRVTTENAGATTAQHVSYRVVLRPGMAYVAGSASAGEPTLSVANAPSPGYTTLVWRSTADLPAGKRHTLSLKASHTPSAQVLHNTLLQIQAGAYATGDPGVVPVFSPATGQPNLTADPDNPAGQATSSATSQVSALSVTKSSDAPREVMLRGVHDRQAIYTLTVKNTSAGSTTSVNLHDYLPPGLEYLGCNVVDNTSGPEEYPGAGDITGSAPAGCRTPSVVQLVQPPTDPIIPAGMYTRVQWNLGSMSAGQEIIVRYRAAVPMRRNALWSVGDPQIGPGASGAQAANLDNNTGPETAAGDVLTSHAFARGTHASSTVTQLTALSQTVADVRVSLSPSSAVLAPGTGTTWTVGVDTSEYTAATDPVVTVTLPDGLCPLKAGDNLAGPDPSDAECGTPPGGPDPSEMYSSAVEQADGTWALTWSGLPDRARRAAPLTFTFPSRTRSDYQESMGADGPIRAGDQVTAAAHLSATLEDSSVATSTDERTLSAALPTLDTKIATQPAATDCTDAGSVQYGDATTVATAPVFGYGDRVCWRLDASFPAGVATAGTGEVVGVFPTSATLDGAFGVGGDQPIAATDNSGATFAAGPPIAGGGSIGRWTFASTQADGTTRFARHVATRVMPPAGAAVSGLQSQITRIASENLAGERAVSRDSAGYTVHAPLLTLGSRITKHNDTTPATPLTTATVKGLDQLTLRLTATNTGTASATTTELWSRLPDGHTCADVSAITDSGACAAGVVSWTVPAIAAGGNAERFYTLTLRTSIQPSESLTAPSGVREYQSPTNVGGVFRYVPAGNIDPAHEATLPQPDAMAVAAASAQTQVTVAAPSVAITRTTSVSQTGGGEDETVTIAERINYTATVTLPRGTTIHDGVLHGDLLGQQPYVPDTIAWSGGPAEAQGAVDDSGASLTATLAPVYTTPATAYTDADTTISFTFQSFLDNDPANVRGQQVQGRTRLTYTPPGGGPAATVGPQTVLTRIAEPRAQLQMTATAHRADSEGELETAAAVAAGDVVTYEARLSAASGTTPEPTTPLYDATLTDTIPAGLTPLGTDGQPLAAAGATEAGGMWDPGTRTITFSPPAVIPAGPAAVFTYRVAVDEWPYGRQQFTNGAVATATSMAGAVAGERVSTGPGNGYHATASQTVTAQAATVQHAADKPRATIGELVGYTTTITLPPNVNYYDVTAVQDLPPYLEFEAHNAAGTRCTSPDPCDGIGDVEPYPATTLANGVTKLAWNVGDVVADADVRTVTLRYSARVRATRAGTPGGNVNAGAPERTLVRIGSNATDKQPPFDPGNPPAIPVIPADFDDTSVSGQFQLRLIEPAATVRKYVRVAGQTPAEPWSLTQADVRPGDTVEFRIEVSAGGNATTNTALHDVVITDTVDTQQGYLTDVQAVSITPSAGVSLVKDWAEGDPSMTWEIDGPIAQGSSVQIVYSAKLAPVTELDDSMNVGGAASMTSAWALPLAERSPLAANPADTVFRKTYSTLGSSAVARVDTPTPQIRKYVGAGGSATSGSATLRQELTFRLQLTNTGYTAAAKDAEVLDRLPQGWEYVAGSAAIAIGPAAPSPLEPSVDPGGAGIGPLLTWAGLADIPAGQTAAITYKARPLPAAATLIGHGAGLPHVATASATVRDVHGNAADKQNAITGDATGTYRAAGPTAGSAKTETMITLNVPELGMSAGVSAATAYAGAGGGYTIDVSNSGAAPATDVTVTGTLPTGTVYTAGSATAVPGTGFAETEVDGNVVTWTIASIPAGQSVVITVPVMLDDDLAGGTLLTSQVTAADELGSHNANASITAQARADLEAGVTAPASAVAGSEVTFNATLQSNGPSRAADSTLTAVVPAGTTFVSATPTGAGASCGEDGGTITCDYGSLRSGDTRDAAITVRVGAGATGSVGMTVTAGSATTDHAPANNSAVVAASVTHEADLALALTDDARPGREVMRDGALKLTFSVTNAGPSDATGVALTATLPAGLGASALGAGCSYTDAPADLTALCVPDQGGPQQGVVAAGDTVTFVITRLGSTQGGPFTVSGQVAATTTDPAPANDAVSLAYTVGPASDLQAGLSAPATVAPDGVVTYRATVTNDGPDPASGVRLTMPLPAGMAWHSSAGCSLAAGVVTCHVGALASGASADREFKLHAPFALGSSTINAAVTASGNEGDPVAGNDTATATTDVAPASNLIIEAGAPSTAVAGGEITWQVVVRNLGPSTATGVHVNLHLPDGIPFSSASSSQGSCGVIGADVRCDLGTIAVDPSGRRAGRSTTGRVTITVRAVVPVSLAGRTVTVAMDVTANEPDPEPSSRNTAGTTVLTAPAAPPADPGPPAGPPAGPGPVPGPPGPPAGPAPGPGGPGALPPTTMSISVKQPGQNKSKKKSKKATAMKVRGGARLTVTLSAKNTGKRTAHNVRVCTTLPGQLTYRSTRGGELEDGELCFTVKTLAPKKTRSYKVKVRVNPRSKKGRATMRSYVVAENAKRRVRSAKFQITTTGKLRPEVVRGFTG